MWRDEEEDIQDMVTSYFMNLFKAAASFYMDPILQTIEPCISQENNEALTKNFTGEEVPEALFQMHPNKAAPPDVAKEARKLKATILKAYENASG